MDLQPTTLSRATAAVAVLRKARELNVRMVMVIIASGYQILSPHARPSLSSMKTFSAACSRAAPISLCSCEGRVESPNQQADPRGNVLSPAWMERQLLVWSCGLTIGSLRPWRHQFLNCRLDREFAGCSLRSVPRGSQVGRSICGRRRRARFEQGQLFPDQCRNRRAESRSFTHERTTVGGFIPLLSAASGPRQSCASRK